VPIYDFRCEQCGKISEIFVRSAADQDVGCPECGSGKMERLISSSYLVKTTDSSSETTCCGRAERCETLPCSGGGGCHQH
jgi:putative FmdB family regulatory protein